MLPLHYPCKPKMKEKESMIPGSTFPRLEAAEKVHHENDDGE